ncbi:MAG: ATP-dependent DNA ligase [Actinomycetota bacterium]
MDLPVRPPLAPMLARSVPEVPDPADFPGGLWFEPKWDGFRALVFRDGTEVEVGSRNERPLTRYFPEVVAAVRDQLPDRCVVDGEVVVVTGDRLDFDALLNRIHPAASRIRLLAAATPAALVVFDLLALGDESLLDAPFAARRARLEQALAEVRAPIHLTPATTDRDLARSWFAQFEGAGLDGVVAKPGDLPYQPDRRAMLKVKHERTADCVVAGYRPHKSGPVVGSLLLGLYDDRGGLQHVGVAAAFTQARRAELAAELAPLVLPDAAGHPWAAWADPAAHADGRLPGAVSRWNATKDLSWVPLRPERVCEVSYDHMEGTRFRHTAQFRRWRADRDPASCTYQQLAEPVRYDLAEVLGQPVPRVGD